MASQILRKRYVITSRSGAHMASGVAGQSMLQVTGALSQMQVPFVSLGETATNKVAYLTFDQAQNLSDIQNVIIEEDLQCHLLTEPVLEPFNLLRFPGGSALTIETVDQTTGNPVPFVTVYLFTDWQAKTAYEATTDANGRAVIDVAPTVKTFEIVLAYPKRGYWSQFVQGIGATPAGMKITLQALRVDNSQRWGLEQTCSPQGKGSGVRIGVIDSGIYRTHRNFDAARSTPVHGKNFLDNEPEDEWWNDLQGHGTHVAGVIGGKAHGSQGGLDGYAPEAELYAYRVYGAKNVGGYFSTINRAIQQAIADQCDIINLSLGGGQSGTMRENLQDAVEQGILCIAAAGNSSSSVEYPAAFDETIAVAALGRFGTYPVDSTHFLQQSSIITSDRELYAAKFTCYGTKIAVAAPGVAVLSSVPEDGFCAMDGTSMACPHVVGLAAALLSEQPNILAMPRDGSRTIAIRDLILNTTQDIGLPTDYMGKGLPKLP